MTKEEIAQIGAFMQFNRDILEQQGGWFGLTLAKLLNFMVLLHIESVVDKTTTVLFSVQIVK